MDTVARPSVAWAHALAGFLSGARSFLVGALSALGVKSPSLLVPEFSFFANSYTASNGLPRRLAVPDYFLGYRFPRGHDLVGRKSFLSKEAVAAAALRDRRPLVINLGDSSTSGWNSLIIAENQRRFAAGERGLATPFFTYLNYVDVLADLVRKSDPMPLVINAGVPGFSSLQGRRYLSYLLSFFGSLGAQIAAVTLYFGNNDALWNCNRRDDITLPSDAATIAGFLKDAILRQMIEKGLETTAQQASSISPGDGFAISTRVSEEEYASNMEWMCLCCERYGARPIVVVPVTPKRWRPGDFASGQSLVTSDLSLYAGGLSVLRSVEQAILLWEEARSLESRGRFSEAEEVFGAGAELDFLVPRIKKGFAESLVTVSSKLRVPLVDCRPAFSEMEDALFLDYCHPIGLLNDRIAQAIVEVLQEPGATSDTLSASRSVDVSDALSFLGKEEARAFAAGYRDDWTNRGGLDDIYPLF